MDATIPLATEWKWLSLGLPFKHLGLSGISHLNTHTNFNLSMLLNASVTVTIKITYHCGLKSVLISGLHSVPTTWLLCEMVTKLTYDTDRQILQRSLIVVSFRLCSLILCPLPNPFFPFLPHHRVHSAWTLWAYSNDCCI